MSLEPAPTILIRGDGVAAWCCAHLLRLAGLDVAMERVDRPQVPAIMLGDQALALIRDVFGRPALLADLPRIDARVVAWGDAAEAITVPHGAVILSEARLIEELSGIVAADLPALQPTGRPGFTIHTVAPLPSGGPQRFGSRRASAAPVTLRNPEDLSRCLIEAVEEGWLFLVPNAQASIWLLGIGAPIDRLLARSRLVARCIVDIGAGSAGIETCPRIADPVVGEDWLACGTAAIAFDPICGDGTAQAIREAILASAVIVAIAEGGDASALRSHYAAMLVAAMRRHLALCSEFYRTGGVAPWWQGELAALVEGHSWCTAKLATAAAPRYQLEGYRLVAREAFV